MQAVDELGHVAEGVYNARMVVQRAAVGVDMPIAQAVVDLLDGRTQPAQAVAALMGREPTAERAYCVLFVSPNQAGPWATRAAMCAMASSTWSTKIRHKSPSPGDPGLCRWPGIRP